MATPYEGVIRKSKAYLAIVLSLAGLLHILSIVLSPHLIMRSFALLSLLLSAHGLIKGSKGEFTTACAILFSLFIFRQALSNALSVSQGLIPSLAELVLILLLAEIGDATISYVKAVQMRRVLQDELILKVECAFKRQSIFAIKALSSAYALSIAFLALGVALRLGGLTFIEVALGVLALLASLFLLTTLH